MKKTYLLLLCLFTGIMGYAQTKDEHYFKVAKNLDIFNAVSTPCCAVLILTRSIIRQVRAVT